MRPVTATRTDACALPSFKPWASPVASSDAFSDSAVQSTTASYATIESRSTATDSVAPNVFAHAASSITGSGRNKKSTTPAASAKVTQRGWMCGAMARNICSSKRSAGNGASAASNHGRQAAAN